MSNHSDGFDGLGGEEQVERNIWLNKGIFQDVKDLNSYPLPELKEQLSRAQGVAVYLCWEVMNSVTLHAVAGSESIARIYSKVIRDLYESKNLPCKVKIERVVVNHYFASTMVDYAVHDPTYVNLREGLSEIKKQEEKEKMDIEQAHNIIKWGKRKGYIND